MKRISVISFAVLYLLLTAGLTMNVHYCLGEVESISLIPIPDKCCCDTAEIPLNCCGDEQIIFQFSPDDQWFVSHTHDLKPLLVEIIDLPPVQLIQTDHCQQTIQSHSKSPPPDGVPIWLMHSNFTFYG
jgi:hypothetical protein